MRTLLGTLLLSLGSGCSLFGGLRVESLASGAERPSNVAAYVTVSDGDEPITDLLESNFVLYEDDKPLSAEATKKVLLDASAVATHRTLLLVDASQARSAAARESLARAVQGFVEKVRSTQPVSVFAFDGDAQLKPIGEYPQAESGSVDAGRLAALRDGDPSRNLNGALLKAIAELDHRLSLTRKTVQAGTLVVFASGPDLAGRVDGNEVYRALDERSFAVITIGVGAKAPAELSGLGKNGFVAAQSADSVAIAFEEAAYKVRNEFEKHYLIAYCSPARAGKRRLRIEVRFTDKKGSDKKGDTEIEFDAHGFGPGCDAERLPRLTPVRARVKSSDKKPASAPAPAPSAHQPGELPGGDIPASETAAPKEDGPVVPPPKRPGYAP